MNIDKKIFDIIVCPNCRGKLKEENENLICVTCNSTYKIENGIPILLIGECDDN